MTYTRASKVVQLPAGQNREPAMLENKTAQLAAVARNPNELSAGFMQ